MLFEGAFEFTCFASLSLSYKGLFGSITWSIPLPSLKVNKERAGHFYYASFPFKFSLSKFSPFSIDCAIINFS